MGIPLVLIPFFACVATLALSASFDRYAARKKVDKDQTDQKKLIPDSDVDEKEPILEAEFDEKEDLKPVRICITGFGSFGGYGENPSTLTARHLEKRTLTAYPRPLWPSPHSDSSSLPSTLARKIEIVFKGPVEVTYSAVKSVISDLYEKEAFDACIHVGVASGSKGGLRIEQRARQIGYQSPGSDGKLCGKVGETGERGIVEWPTVGDQKDIWSGIDCVALVRWLNTQMGVEHVVSSTDAGLYLCEYIYGTSLSKSSLTNKKPVLFVHVPDLKTSQDQEATYTELEVADVLERICWWVGRSV